MAGSIADVRCPSCGAPANYDIIRGRYLCAYCGAMVELRDAMAQKQGFRSIQQAKIRESAQQRRLMRANCTGCGAELVFEQGEAMSNCAFCGRALVRKDYLASEDLPELIIPFRITREEAMGCLNEWCAKNARRPEAKHLREALGGLEGFYLPYELVRGPVYSSVSRMDGGRVYHCSGYVDDVFVNCSKQLDNLLLDGAEPFELDDVRPFDFSWAAGQRIKIGDIGAGELKSRVGEEVSNDYAPVVRKTLETKAVNVDTNTDNVLRMPVLLPMYYLCAGEVMAAVNGQTGKVSVRAEKESHYYFLPWWLKAILSTVAISAAAFAAFRFFGMAQQESLITTAMLALVTLMVTFVAFSDTVRNKVRVEAGRKIFTSSGGPLRRENGALVRDAKAIRKQVTPPVFYETLDGQAQWVKLVFSSPIRKLRMMLLAVVALFLPVIIALFLNGFDFERLTLGGSAVWFCIAVPVVPIYLLKFGVISLYENPWIYILYPDGTKRRYRKKRERKLSGDTVKTILAVLFVPPISLGVWFGIICFCVMCYLTAFGFD
jgi:predicted RNA-binding Zn-ribbon protein involved in translation (DUF1610 family)